MKHSVSLSFSLSLFLSVSLSPLISFSLSLFSSLSLSPLLCFSLSLFLSFLFLFKHHGSGASRGGAVRSALTLRGMVPWLIPLLVEVCGSISPTSTASTTRFTSLTSSTTRQELDAQSHLDRFMRWPAHVRRLGAPPSTQSRPKRRPLRNAVVRLNGPIETLIVMPWLLQQKAEGPLTHWFSQWTEPGTSHPPGSNSNALRPCLHHLGTSCSLNIRPHLCQALGPGLCWSTSIGWLVGARCCVHWSPGGHLPL